MKVRPKPPVSELENASWGTGEEEHDIFDELSNRDFVVVTWCNSIFYSTSGHKVPPLMYWSDQAACDFIRYINGEQLELHQKWKSRKRLRSAKPTLVSWRNTSTLGMSTAWVASVT